jgi:hypothetical protein
MTTDDRRALLLAFVEWYSKLDYANDGGCPDADHAIAFLAQHEGERPQTGGPIPLCADLVVVFDDKTAEKRSDEEITELTRRLAEVAGPYGYDRHLWGTREQVMAAFRRQVESPVPHVKVTEVVGRLEESMVPALDWTIRTNSDEIDIRDLSPHPAAGLPLLCPRGRFRITVEFWPEDKP